MENEITVEQQAHLATWAGKRDLILLEISNLQTAKSKLEQENKEIASSYTDIEARMNQVLGRIEELNKKEKELPLLILKDIAHLESKKTCLESEIMNLAKLVEVLTVQKTSIEKDVSSALNTFNTIKDETLALDKIVDHVTRVSSDNTKKIDDLVVGLAKSLNEIIEVNKKNVFETNTVIEKLPSMLVEVQKRGLIKHKI